MAVKGRQLLKERNLWMRTGEFSCCRHCGRSDRPHDAKGFCVSCYNYHRDPESEKARRKQRRIDKDVVAQRYPKVRTWHEENAEHVKEYKRAWHLKKNPPKWQVGMTVWAKFVGFWCRGEIIEKPNNTTVVVQLAGGTIVRTKGPMIRTVKPNDLEDAA